MSFRRRITRHEAFNEGYELVLALLTSSLVFQQYINGFLLNHSRCVWIGWILYFVSIR